MPGSGKTRVLTDRVARLLLDGVSPQHILCLTYTKAAAGEMQNRLFRRLGEWAMLEDAALRAELARLGVGRGDRRRRAGRGAALFARAIETPGGLKIQTIHSFCAALLRRFPLEAGVSPQFAEMEDRAAALLRARDRRRRWPRVRRRRGWPSWRARLTGEDFDRARRRRSSRRRAGLSARALDRRRSTRWFGLPPRLDAAELAGAARSSAPMRRCVTLIAACCDRRRPR